MDFQQANDNPALAGLLLREIPLTMPKVSAPECLMADRRDGGIDEMLKAASRLAWTVDCMVPNHGPPYRAETNDAQASHYTESWLCMIAATAFENATKFVDG